MSDDEYYADSLYDEFEEMLWDADPGSNLADDLAQHTAYSPVWQDDPGGELEPYHSDWEYYSDDYFDDDPAILKNNPIDGTPSKRKIEEVSTTQGRKRKLDDTHDSFHQLESKFLKGTIRGTVWAKKVAPNIETFRYGQNDKVALLTDWRERFHTSKKRRSSAPARSLERDESWANELGLADMGLMRAGERTGTQQEVLANENGADDNETEHSDYDATIRDDSPNEEAYVQEESSEMLSQQKSNDTSLEQVNMPADKSSEIPEYDDSGRDTDSRARKKPRLSMQTSPRKLRHEEGKVKSPESNSVSKEPRNADESGHEETGPETQERHALAKEQLTSNLSKMTTRNGLSDRKRRLSTSSEETLGSARSNGSSRRKRVASSKLDSNQPRRTEQETPAKNARAAKVQKR